MSLQMQRSSRTEVEPDPSSGLPTIVFPICNNPLLRVGLEKILSDAGFGVWREIIEEPSLLPNIHSEVRVLFIIDGNTYGAGAVEMIAELKARAPEGRIVILADAFQPAAIAAAWDAGAHGFCLSTHRHDVLIKFLELVMLGEAVLPSEIVLSLAEGGERYAPPLPADAMPQAEAVELANRKLSNREAEILVCLKEGAPNKVIARRLNLSEATVKVHVKAILKKVGVCNRTQAALWATRNIPASLTSQ
jgi:two-component system nitrate/nitrite response regulator NarL